MTRFRVVVVRDGVLNWDGPEADEVVSAATSHQAAALVLRSIGGGFAESIKVYVPGQRVPCARFLDVNHFAGEFTYGVSYL